MGGAAELESGEVFARRYEIQRRLGEGDRKCTYLARDAKMDRLVAVSLVKPKAVVLDPEGTEREAKVLGRIGSNANIVSLYDYEIASEGSAQYMVFQYLGGGTLAEYLKDADPLPLEDILRLARQLCRGLSHLHKGGLIHRDVSPDNIWLDEHCAAHLGDFDSAITTTGADELRPLTTNSFAAPEEQEGRELDVRTDLYSLGGVLYVIATGSGRPGDPDLLRSQRPDLPSAFADLVTSLLSEAPEDRPADAEAVLERLGEIRYTSNVDALIAAGESDKVELKSSLHHQHGPLPPDLQYRLDQGKLQPVQVRKEMQKRLNKAVTKTIAAFLNSNGGALLIGVDDAGTVLGIDPDFDYCKEEKQDADGWLLSLKDVIINALDADVWSAIRVSLVPRGKTVAVVLCPRRASQTWHFEDGGERFYIRAGNATEELSGRSLVGYVHEHWAT